MVVSKENADVQDDHEGRSGPPRKHGVVRVGEWQDCLAYGGVTMRLPRPKLTNLGMLAANLIAWWGIAYVISLALAAR